MQFTLENVGINHYMKISGSNESIWMEIGNNDARRATIQLLLSNDQAMTLAGVLIAATAQSKVQIKAE